MFLRKCEKKKHGATAVLLVGMLAAVGVLAITKKGKDMVSCVSDKVKGFFKKECTKKDSGSTACHYNEE